MKARTTNRERERERERERKNVPIFTSSLPSPSYVEEVSNETSHQLS
jgi:hypothetical protein